MPKKPDSIPATISPSEKQDVLHRLDRRLGQVAHRYAFQIKHGGTVEKKQRTNSEIKMLQNDPMADVQVEKPTSERVTTALTSDTN